MLKKICMLFMMLTVSNMAEAQMFAPNQGSANQKAAAQNTAAASSNQAAAEKQPILDENGAPNYVVKKFDSDDDSVKYDNSERKVFTLKMVGDELVVDDNARTILISYENYQINQSFDNWVRCSLRVYVLNDLTERVTNFSFKLHWPDIDASVQMNRLNPGVRTYKDIVLLGNGCFNLDKTPTIEVNRCRVKGMSQEQCADAVKWYQSKK